MIKLKITKNEKNDALFLNSFIIGPTTHDRMT